jgi:hypothetical protein
MLKKRVQIVNRILTYQLIVERQGRLLPDRDCLCDFHLPETSDSEGSARALSDSLIKYCDEITAFRNSVYLPVVR